MPLVVWTLTGVTEEKGVRDRFRFARVFLGWTAWNRDGQASTSSPVVLVRSGTWSVPLRGDLFFPCRFLSFVFLVPFVSDLRSCLRKTTYRLRCVVRATRSLDARRGNGGEGSPGPVPPDRVFLGRTLCTGTDDLPLRPPAFVDCTTCQRSGGRNLFSSALRNSVLEVVG